MKRLKAIANNNGPVDSRGMPKYDKRYNPI